MSSKRFLYKLNIWVVCESVTFSWINELWVGKMYNLYIRSTGSLQRYNPPACLQVTKYFNNIHVHKCKLTMCKSSFPKIPRFKVYFSFNSKACNYLIFSWVRLITLLKKTHSLYIKFIAIVGNEEISFDIIPHENLHLYDSYTHVRSPSTHIIK